MNEKGLISADEVKCEFELFEVNSYSILIDKTSVAADIPILTDFKLEDVFTFSLDLIGMEFCHRKVKLLTVDTIPDSSAWLLASDTRVVYALTDLLFSEKREEQLIVRLYQKSTATMFSYVDWFKGETDSNLYLTHIFERTHGITYPIDIRYILRDLKGRAILKGQRIIAPNQTIHFSSRDMKIDNGFAGYIEIYANVRPLNSPILPFYHMYVDYISANSVASMHQSGLSPWKANNPFFRGYFPDNNNQHLVVSLLNKFNSESVQPIARLEYGPEEKRIRIEKKMKTIAQGEMVFEDMNELFEDDVHKEEPLLTIVADKDIHRPNYYIGPKNKDASWFDIEHGCVFQRRAAENAIPESKLKLLKQCRSYPWQNNIPLLPLRFDIETVLMYFGESSISYRNFLFVLHDSNGRKIFEKEEYIKIGSIIGMDDYCEKNGIEIDRGLLIIAPSPSIKEVPVYAHFKVGFRHRKNSYITSTVAGGNTINVNYDFDGGRLWKNEHLPIMNSEQFARGVFSKEFDTIVTVIHSSSLFDYKDIAKVDIDLYSANGSMNHFVKEIAPCTSSTFSLGELLDLSKKSEDYYSIWIKCRNRYVNAYHFLHRKKDNAIGVEHFYYGRFNTPRLAKQ